ncbi:hypothetical protein SHK09_10935 [Polaribacter sp. PL03]|uniref:hypothetical protein n=1 Tax=Polaribacter sp. PL03 TaxID=3088353 RepID=UPI0029D132FE|nr:hypothetical protein [Polaribacter sp. PL03]MDX6747308.1 hypothetical protein [Polaribacter sp. PL03]
MTNNSTKTATSFWVISIIALLWNLMGVSSYLFYAFVTEEMVTDLPAEQKAEMLIEQPSWLTAIYALAVFGGLLGSILLLMRKKIAYYFLVISAICATIQQVYILLDVELEMYIMSILIIIACIFLV